jgi:hypothetical protein
MNKQVASRSVFVFAILFALFWLLFSVLDFSAMECGKGVGPSSKAATFQACRPPVACKRVFVTYFSSPLEDKWVKNIGEL